MISMLDLGQMLLYLHLILKIGIVETNALDMMFNMNSKTMNNNYLKTNSQVCGPTLAQI